MNTKLKENFIEYHGSGGQFGGFNAIRNYIGVGTYPHSEYSGAAHNYVYPYGNYLNYSTQTSSLSQKQVQNKSLQTIIGV